jgi:hypothetical protein
MTCVIMCVRCHVSCGIVSCNVMSCVMCHVSWVMGHVYSAMCHMSYVPMPCVMITGHVMSYCHVMLMCHISCVICRHMCHVLFFMCHVSCVI